MKQIGISSPAVISTYMQPLQDVTLTISSNGEPLDQWYYVNDDLYKPNRKIDNLILYPSVTVRIKEEDRTTEPVIASARWYYRTDEVWTEIVATLPSADVDYYKSGNNLVVTKNVYPLTPVQLKVVLVWQDPRTVQVPSDVSEGFVELTTSQNSDETFPTLEVKASSSQLFHPIVDEDDSYFYFIAEAKWHNQDISSIVDFEWSVLDKKASPEEAPAEEVSACINTPGTITVTSAEDPLYGQTLTKNLPGGVMFLDAWYGEHLTAICRARYKYTLVEATSGNPKTSGWLERTVVEQEDYDNKNPKALGWCEKLWSRMIDEDVYWDMYIPSTDTTASSSKHYYTVTYTESQDTSMDSSKQYFTTEGELFPAACYNTVKWEEFKIDAQTVCGGGNSVSTDVESRTFDTIINIRHRTLTDEQKLRHLLFKWYWRQTYSDTLHFCGDELKMTLNKDVLLQKEWNNVVVYPEIYMQGNYREWIINGEQATFNGEVVYSRT